MQGRNGQHERLSAWERLRGLRRSPGRSASAEPAIAAAIAIPSAAPPASAALASYPALFAAIAPAPALPTGNDLPLYEHVPPARVLYVFCRLERRVQRRRPGFRGPSQRLLLRSDRDLPSRL